MATTKITLYQVDFTAKDNAKVEAMESYLAARQIMVFDNQKYTVIRPDITVKLDVDQTHASEMDWNYAKLENSDENKSYYYFILDTRWLSRSGVEYTLSIDSINTFWTDFTPLMTANTLVTRRHKDRFVRQTVPSTGTITLVRNVDTFDEGINPVKFRTEAPVAIPYKTDVNQDWYLIYKTVKPLTDADKDNPLKCYLCAGTRLLHTNSTTSFTITQASISNYTVYFLKSDNTQLTFTLGGATYTWNDHSTYGSPRMYAIQGSSSGLRVEGVFWNTTTQTYQTLALASGVNANIVVTNGTKYRKNITHTLDMDTVASYQSFNCTANTGTYIEPIGSILWTDSSIMKIIKLPYPPCDVIRSGSTYTFDTTRFIYDNDMHMMRAVALNEEFLSSITNVSIANEMTLTLTAAQRAYGVNKAIGNESKLYNSSMFTYKLMYDQYSKEILLERWNKSALGSQVTLNDIKFKPSNNIQSKFLFKVSSSNYNEIDDYSEFMVVDRNNEISLYNNDYVNYIRDTEKYEKSQLDARLRTQRAIAITQTVAGIGAFAASAVTGGISAAAGISLISGAVATWSSLANDAASGERTIQQKKEQLAAQSGSVTNSDVNLMSYYSGNRLQKITYGPSNTVKTQLFNLFHYTGYKDNTYMVPDFYTRIYFDFLQCVPDFLKDDWKYPSVYLDDVTARLEAGITIYHPHNGTYDFEQKYENYERWIIQ